MNALGQREFDAFFDNAAMGIVTVDPNGRIVMANHFALQLFGYQLNELLDQPIEKLIPARARARHEGLRKNYQHHSPLKRPMGVGLDLSGLRKDGSEFPVEVSLSSFSTENGLFSIAFISDITVRKTSENALLKLKDELERKVEVRTQSLREALDKEKELSELKSRFVSMASHEFRTPLSAILSSAYLVSKYTSADDQPKRDKHIQRIVSSVNMLTDILNDFLSVGRIEEGRVQVRPAQMDIPSWIGETVSEIEPVLRKGQSVEYAHEGPANVCLDPSLLKHIVQNLVSNAIKFSPEDAVIRLRTRRDAEFFEMSVSDQGIGIPEEDQQHLFGRFFRGTNAVHLQGTGLGLHIVSKYAELMHGAVSFESEVGKGSTFTVTFQTEPPLE